MDVTSQKYFETASLGNTMYDSSNEIITQNADFMSVDKTKIGNASFDDPELVEGFDKVSYKGAFDGINDWTAGWTNFDPQNTEY